MDKDNLKLIGRVHVYNDYTKQEEIEELYLKEMYKKGEGFENCTFVCTWYNVTQKQWFKSAWTGEEAFLKYDKTSINIEYIQHIKTLVDRCINSYFCNGLQYIKSVEYVNNRFILNDIESR